MKLYQATSLRFSMSAVKSGRARSHLYIAQPWRVIVSSFAFRLPAVERGVVFLSLSFQVAFAAAAAAELLLSCC